MPPTAVLGGLLIIISFAMSHACVSISGTEWIKPVLLWISIGMPTGSGKSPLFKYLLAVRRKTRTLVWTE